MSDNNLIGPRATNYAEVAGNRDVYWQFAMESSATLRSASDWLVKSGVPEEKRLEVLATILALRVLGFSFFAETPSKGTRP